MKKAKYVYMALIVLFFAVFSVINFVGLERFCDSDMYQDIYVSKIIFEQKKFFPDNWTFSNQYFILATPVLTAVVYGITGNLNLSMNIATSIFSILIIASFGWMVKEVIECNVDKNKREDYIMILLFTIVAFMGAIIGKDTVNTQQGQIYFLTVSYYGIYTINLFVVFGYYIRLLSKSKISKITLLLCILLSFTTGMQSLRQTAIMICPLIVVEGIRFFYKIYRKTYLKADFSITLKMAIISIANVIGYGIVTFVIKPSHHILYGNTGIRTGESIKEGFLLAMSELFEITGLISFVGNENYEKSVVLGCVAIIFTGIIIYGLISSLAKVFTLADKNDISVINVLLILLFLGVLGIAALGTLMSVNVRHLYYFLWFPLTAVSIYYMSTVISKKVYMGYLLAMTSIIVLNFIIGYGTSAVSAFDQPEEEQIIAKVLQENGIKYLYGNWNQVPEIAVYSNDSIIAGGWYFKTLEPINYLNPKGIYSEEDNEFAAYLISDEEMEEIMAENDNVVLTVIYESDSYKIYRSSRQLMKVNE